MYIKKLSTIEEIINAFQILKHVFHSFDGVLNEYCKKIHRYGICYACVEEKPFAIIAFYANDMQTKIAYITSILVCESQRGKGVASKLLDKVKDYCLENGFKKIRLEVKVDNEPAIRLYQKHGYIEIGRKSDSIYFEKTL